MKKLLADLFAKKEKSRHAAAAKKTVRLPRLRDIHFRSIRARGMFVGSGLVLLAIVISLAAYTLSLQAYYYSATRASLQAKAETASAFLSSYVDRTYAEFYQRAFNYAENFDDKDSLELQFVNTEGRVEIASTGISAGSIPGSDDIKNALDSGKISFWQGKRASTGEKVLAVSAPLVSGSGSVVGVMRYITSLKLIDRAVNTSSLVAGGIGLVVLAIVVFSNLYFLRTITEPIASLTGVARRIAEGSYGAQVEKTHNDEIGELTDAINDMSQKLSQAERVQTEFISSVSHELRTPLTAITGWAETIQSGELRDPKDVRKGMDIIVSEARRLTNMVEELLEFSRISEGRFTLSVEPLDLKAELEDAVYTYREFFRREGIELTYQDCPEESIPIIGDPERLRQVFCNLLDNAAKHGGSGGRIDVSIRQDLLDAVIQIRDYGPGIPEEELPFIKNKFYKGSSKARGSGIGLSVCEEITTRHEGTLDIGNAEGGGCLVTIRLPIKT